MMDRKSIDKFFICSCYSEGIRLSYWPEDRDLYLSLWQTRSYNSVGWKQRLKHIWRIIRTGEPWCDEVMLTIDEAKAMGQYLIALEQVPQ